MLGGVIGSVVGGLFQASAAKSGARAQTAAANQANETQRYIYDRNVELSEPWRETGQNALAALAFETGIGPRPTYGGTGADGTQITEIPGSTRDVRTTISPGDPGFVRYTGDDDYMNSDAQHVWKTVTDPSRFEVGDATFDTRDAAQEYAAANTAGGTGVLEYGGFKESPGYQFRLDEGQTALERMAAARGLRLSGGTLKEAARFGDGMASQEYGNYYNRLAGLAGVGQAAVGQQQAAGTNYASAFGQNTMAAGRAKASGYQGQANAFGGTMNNLFSIYGAAQGGMFGQNPGFGIKPFGVA